MKSKLLRLMIAVWARGRESGSRRGGETARMAVEMVRIDGASPEVAALACRCSVRSVYRHVAAWDRAAEDEGVQRIICDF